MNREELAWAAGFFDGEGTIGCYVNTNGYRCLRMGVKQVVDGPLQRFHAAVQQGTVSNPQQRPESVRAHHRPVRTWAVSSFEGVQSVVCLLWPWLSNPKRQQAKAALLAFHTYGKGKVA